jgi:hypothetical protein
MSETETVARLFQARPHNVYGPYRGEENSIGYDVDLQDLVARVYILDSHKLVIRIEGFSTKAHAQGWIDSVLTYNGAVTRDVQSNTWSASLPFYNVDLSTLLQIYDDSRPLLQRF